MRFTFIAEEHEEFGLPGWRQKGQPGFDPLMGMAVAHDALEHFRDGDDSIEDELQALGAALYIRGNGGYWMNATPGVHIGSDLPEIIGHHVFEDMPMPPEPPRTKRLEDWAESEIDIAIQSATREWADRCDGEEQMQQARALLARARGWFRIGYRRAQRRYKGTDCNQLSYLFKQIEEAADRKLKHAETGDELTLRVNIRRLSFEATVRRAYDCD
jgi:hypothetical protein